jgi:hypothetical protein
MRKNDLEGEGTLQKTIYGRWSLKDIDVSCGDCIQVKLGEQWITIRLEYDGQDFYAIPLVINLRNGLRARFLAR